MNTMGSRKSWCLVGFRVFVALCLLLTTGLGGWTGRALAADTGDGRQLAQSLVSGSAVLPAWFLPHGSSSPASFGPPAGGRAAPLFDGEPIDQIIICDAAGGLGNEVTSQSLTADQTLTLWAAGYLSGTYQADQTVDWLATNGIGIVSPTTGLSTTFYANVVGTGTVSATHPVIGTLTDTIDTITVTLGSLNNIVVTPASMALNPGGTQQFSALGYDSDNNVISGLSYTWSVGDANSGSISASGLFTAGIQDDVYPDTVRASADDGGGPVTGTATVTVNNVSPTADAGGPYSDTEGSSVPFTGSGSDDNGDPLTYEWDLDYDGSNFTVDHTGTTTTTFFADDVSRQVAFRVTDDKSLSAVDATTLTINNVAPTVNAGNDKDATEGATVPFSGSFTDPGTEDTHEIEWDFGDGSIVVGTLTPTHVYTDNGTFIVTLTVSDDDGGEGDDTLTVNVSNVAPTVLVGGNQSVDEGDTVILSGTFSDPGTGDTHQIEWDFGDGSVTTGTLNTSHVYTAAGTFVVTLTVEDDDGGIGSDTLTVNVANVPPEAVISSPPTQTAGLDAVFDASGSTEPGQNITAYDWDLDDDGLYDDATGVTTPFSRTATGVYTVGLRVTDAESTTDTDETTITIEPASLNHFVVSVPSSSTAGVGFTTVITAEDEYGNVITDWNQTVTLTTTNGGTISPSVAAGSAFVEGVWTGLVSLTAAGDDRDVVASYDGQTGQDALHIEPAAATQFVFSAIGQQTAGVWSTLFNLIAYDPYGNLDINYDGFKSLSWSGLLTSPNGTGPDFPSDVVNFEDGESDYVRFRAYNAATGVVLQVVASDGPSGASDPFTVTHASSSALVFSQIADLAAGSSGTFTLTAEDEWGNTATGYTGGHTLNWSGLGTSPNSDPPDYPDSPVSFASGVAASLVFTPYLAEANVRIAANDGAGVSGESNWFSVTVGSQVGEIVVESAPNGTGSEVTTHDMVIYDTLDVYAAGYDAWGNFIADQTVDWSGTDALAGQLSPVNGTSSTLTPVISGTGTIVAQYSPTITDATGLITVRAPVLDVVILDSIEPVEAGETLTYTVHYSNTGNAAATDTVLTLTLDNDVDFVSASPAPEPGSGQVRTWSLGTVDFGVFEQIRITVTVASPLDNGTVLATVASLNSSQTDVISDTEETTVHSQPVLDIAKSDLPDPAQAGGSIVYTIEFSNTGNMNATGVVITDVIPANTTFESASHGGNEVGGVVTWTVGTLVAGTTPYRTLVVRVDSPLPVGTVITNTGYQIDSDQTAPVTGPDVTTNVLSPTLTLTQIGSPDPVDAGTLVAFTIDYSNTGDGAAHQVVITDAVPEHTSFAWASGGGTLSNGQVVWNIGTLQGHNGGTVTAAFTVTSPLTDSTAILNQVSIDSAETEPASYVDVVYARSEPELHMAKTDAPDPVQAGGQLVYTIVYSNTGNANASSVVITDPLPTHTEFVAASDGGTYAGGVVTWNLGLLSGRDLGGQVGSGSVVLTVAVDSPLPGDTILTNMAFIDSAEGSHAQASEQTAIAASPQLHVNVDDSPDPVKGDETLVYTVHYSNTGNADATGVQLTADYDSLLTFVAADPAPSSGNDTWNLPLLPGEGGTGTVVITLTTAALPPEAVLNSTFYLDSAETGMVSDVEATEAVAVDLRLSVSHGETDDAPYPGETITYTLYYTNAGDIPATGVELMAQRPDGTTYVECGWSSVGGGSYKRPVGTVGPGANGSVQFIVQVNSTGDHRLPAGLVSIEPSFSIGDDGQNGPEYYTANNTASDLVGIPDLVIDEIRVTPEFPLPNQPVTFTVVVRNQGTGWAWNPNNQGGFYVDLFIDPNPEPQSFPWNGYGDLFEPAFKLAPGQAQEIVMVHGAGLSAQQHTVWAKVDNFLATSGGFEPWQQYSLVPEADEENNLFWIPVKPAEPSMHTIFLPMVLRNH
jgi:uncharacterized repeat protein (TIGR01451 family)